MLGFIAVPSALALAPPSLFWTNFGSDTIGEASLDGTNVNQSFATGGASGVGAAVDGQHLYWAQNIAGEIVRANLDGTDVETNFITGLADPIGVAVDSTHVYWANNVANTIGEANLDGTSVNNTFITGAIGPAGVAVDGRHIYWTNASSGTIGEANLDGTGVNQSLVTGANFPIGIALDGQHIYWTNIGDNTIGEANLDGTDVNERYIASGDSNLFMLATDGQRLYWTNFALSPNGTLGEANVDGTNVNPAFITGASSPQGVAVSVPVAQVSPASPPAFAATPQGTISSPVTLTLSNTGRRSLSVSGLSLSGADPGDYIITSNSCLGSVAPGEGCEITVGFAPQGLGQRTATLQIASNDYANSPLDVPFSGAASAAPAGATGPVGQPGPQGPPGSTGARGATGPRGRQGRRGKIELITCRPVIKKINGRRHKLQRCTGRLVSGTVRFTISSSRVSIERGRVTYATGVSVPLSSGRTQLMLGRGRLIRAGAYTLVARKHQGRKLNTRRTRITITS